MSKYGNKKVLIRIIYLNAPAIHKVFNAPNGQRITEKGINNILARVADNLEKQFTGSDFRLVVIDPAQSILKCPQFNFIESLKTLSETPEVEAEVNTSTDNLRTNQYEVERNYVDSTLLDKVEAYILKWDGKDAE